MSVVRAALGLQILALEILYGVLSIVCSLSVRPLLGLLESVPGLPIEASSATLLGPRAMLLHEWDYFTVYAVGAATVWLLLAIYAAAIHRDRSQVIVASRILMLTTWGLFGLLTFAPLF